MTEAGGERSNCALNSTGLVDKGGGRGGGEVLVVSALVWLHGSSDVVGFTYRGVNSTYFKVKVSYSWMDE